MSSAFGDLSDSYTFELNGNTYQVKRLSVFQQLKVVSKLSPIFVMLAQQKDKDLTKIKFAEFFAAFSNNMQEEQTNEVLKLCLSTVYRRISKTWHPIYKGNDLVYQDINLKDLLNIVYETLEANKLFDFFSENSLTSETNPRDVMG